MSTMNNSTASRRTLLRAAGAGALGVPALSAIAACAPQASSGDDDQDANTEASTITFASWSLNEEASQPVVQGMLDSWAEANGVTVNTAVWPFNEYLNQLTLQIRGGEAVSAAQLSIPWLPQLATFADFIDLSEQAAAGGYTESALAAGQVDGVQLGLPWTIGSIGMLANAELLDRAGVSTPPATIEDFEQMLLALQGIDVIPYAGMTKVAQLAGDIQTWMLAFGSPLVENGRITIGDDASVEAVTWYKSLYDRELIAADVDRFDARALFSQGQAAIYDDAIVAKGILLADSSDPDFESKLQPMARPVTAAASTPVHAFWGHAIAVLGGEGSATAAQLASYLTSDPAATDPLFSELALPPTTTTALESSAVQQDEYTTTWTELITSSASMNPMWQFQRAAQMDSILAEQVQAILIGQASPADGLATAAEEMNALL
jgi:multiple sugar transport system substrate-binding protein